MELGVDVLVAAVYQKLNVLDDFQNSASPFERLRRHPWPVAVMDAVVSPLKDRAKSLLELVNRGFLRRALVWIGHHQIVRVRDAEEPYLRIRPGHPGVKLIAKKLMPLAEELVEQCLYRRQADDVLPLHHFPSGHPPSPVLVAVLFENRPQGELISYTHSGSEITGCRLFELAVAATMSV